MTATADDSSAGAVHAGTSLAAAVAQAAARLAAAGVEAPRGDARLLLGAVVAGGAAAVLGYPERPLTAAEAAWFSTLLRRRAAREPVSHLLGAREFWSLSFQVSSAVLDPRPDSETLIQAVLDAVADRQAPLRLLDFGTGSGCLVLTLLHELPQAHGLGIDRSPAALDVAEANARALGLGARAAFRLGDWGAGIEETFDIIVSNPPYIETGQIATLQPEVSRHEPHLALDGGADGLDAYRALATDLRRLLRPGGLAALEVGAGQSDAVVGIVTAAGGTGAALVPAGRRLDLAGVERCLLFRRVDGRVAG